MGQLLWQQAERDLAVARRLLYPGAYYAVANFAHQGAEKALKAFLYFRGLRRLIGHSTHDLLQQCIQLDPSFETLREDCTELDLHYLPSRYPNSLPGGVPHLFYTKKRAEEVIACARRVIEKVKRLIPE